MAGHPIALFRGASRVAPYPFDVWTLDSPFANVPAVYIFARMTDGLFEPLYIGEADSLRTDPRDYPKWSCVRRHFVTHLCLDEDADPFSREQKVLDLLAFYDPPCNQE
jgi:hypothetical protein